MIKFDIVFKLRQLEKKITLAALHPENASCDWKLTLLIYRIGKISKTS